MAPPAVTGISPKEGPPGTRVTIRGENLGKKPQDLISKIHLTYLQLKAQNSPIGKNIFLILHTKFASIIEKWSVGYRPTQLTLPVA